MDALFLPWLGGLGRGWFKAAVNRTHSKTQALEDGWWRCGERLSVCDWTAWAAEIRGNWFDAGSGTTSPYTTPVDTANLSVFFRLSNQ